MKTRVTLISLLLLCYAQTYLLAQENNKFRQLSTSDGLSQSSVISIAQDKNGLLWFGTRDGLNRYDGKQFTVFRNDPKDSTTLSNNDILDIASDKNGDLWIGTYSGLNRYDYKRDRFIRYYNQAQNNRSLSNNSVWDVTELSNGEIWIGTGGGINIFREEEFITILAKAGDSTSLSGNFILEIFEDSQGIIWVGTSQGLNKMVSKEGDQLKFKQYVQNPKIPSAINDNFVQCIAEDGNGNIWFGTRGGLHRYDAVLDGFVRYLHSDDDIYSISHGDVRSISFDKEGLMWVGTYKGLNKMIAPGRFQHLLNDPNDIHSLSKNTIKSTFVDQKGSLWVGVYYGGINMLDDVNGNFRNYQQLPAGNGLSYDVVSSIVETKENRIYIGTEGKGINILNANTGQVSYLKSDAKGRQLSSNNIKALYLASNRYLWIGTFSTGVDIYDTFTSQFIGHYDRETGLNHNSVYAILQEKEHLFWVGTFGGGLHLLNTANGHLKKITRDVPLNSRLTDNQIRLLLKDVNGNLWVGTQYGLNRLDKAQIEKEDFTFSRYFYNEEKKSGEDILVIFQDSKQRLWVGTYESGLSLYDKATDTFISHPIFDPSEGMSNVIRGILEDADGHLWISSNQGITRYNMEDGSTLTFDESDGLVSNEFNNNACYQSSTGMMYFGGPQGLSSFYPDQIQSNRYAPQAVITGLKLFNQPVKAGAEDGILSFSISETKKITLDYDQAIFSLEFAIPNFINPDKNTYSYRLNGLEKNWNITNKSDATYTIQKAGDYIFEVRGANNEGIWSDEVTTLNIVVNPAPWRTWWAFVIYFFIIFSALYILIVMIQSRSKLRHELELEHVENERQKAVNQMKLRFFTNISHEFRTPLTLILGPLEQILNDYKGSNKLFKQLKVMEKNAVRLLRLINQLMDFRKFENKHERLQAAEGNMIKFVEEIFLSFKQFAKIHQIEYILDKSVDHMTMYYDRDKMERVFYNLISNAFKYTTEGGKISISLSQKENQFSFAITDTGDGMDAEHLEYIFDRFYEIETSPIYPKHQQQKGTGIGLAIAKGVVEMHQGTINAESEKGVGSVFTVLLPLGKAHLKTDQIIDNFKDSEDLSNYLKASLQEEEMLEEVSEFASSNEPNHLGEESPCILIAEDNLSVRQFIVDIFKTEYRILEAENGMEGFKKAIHDVPDLIISDVMMPKMDGIDFCTQTKSNLKTSHIPFILLTARTSLIFKFEGLESGADEYVNKPFNTKELKLKAKNLINASKRMREKFANDSFVKPAEITVSSLDEKLLKQALKIVEENIENEFFNIQIFSAELGVSRTMLFTKLKAWTNLTPNDFIHAMRMNRAAQILEQNKITVSEVSYKVGFTNPKYFSKCFQKFHKLTPSEYAEKFTVTQ